MVGLGTANHLVSRPRNEQGKIKRAHPCFWPHQHHRSQSPRTYNLQENKLSMAVFEIQETKSLQDNCNCEQNRIGPAMVRHIFLFTRFVKKGQTEESSPENKNIYEGLL